MLKKNNKGFMLIETLLVSVFVASTLIFLYIQFQKVRDSYQTTFTYNTVTGTYASSNFLKYLQENGIENLSKTINSGTVSIDLTTCPGGHLSNTALCKSLISELGIKKVYYLSSDTANFLTRMNNTDMTPKFKSFVKSIKINNRVSYRLLFEFEDETYATILARSATVKPIVPTETKITTLCMGGHSQLIWSSACLLVSPSISSNSDYTSSYPITVSAPFMANRKYKVKVTNGAGQFLTSMSGAIADLSYVKYPGEWVSKNNEHTFEFTPTADENQVYLGYGGSYIMASGIYGMNTIITIEVYEIS